MGHWSHSSGMYHVRPSRGNYTMWWNILRWRKVKGFMGISNRNMSRYLMPTQSQSSLSDFIFALPFQNTYTAEELYIIRRISIFLQTDTNTTISYKFWITPWTGVPAELRVTLLIKEIHPFLIRTWMCIKLSLDRFLTHQNSIKISPPCSKDISFIWLAHIPSLLF